MSNRSDLCGVALNSYKLFNKLFHKNLKRSDNYTSSLRFEGNFSSLIKKIKNDYEKQAKNKKLKKYLFYEIIKEKNSRHLGFYMEKVNIIGYLITVCIKVLTIYHYARLKSITLSLNIG